MHGVQVVLDLIERLDEFYTDWESSEIAFGGLIVRTRGVQENNAAIWPLFLVQTAPSSKAETAQSVPPIHGLSIATERIKLDDVFREAVATGIRHGLQFLEHAGFNTESLSKGHSFGLASAADCQFVGRSIALAAALPIIGKTAMDLDLLHVAVSGMLSDDRRSDVHHVSSVDRKLRIICRTRHIRRIILPADNRHDLSAFLPLGDEHHGWVRWNRDGDKFEYSSTPSLRNHEWKELFLVRNVREAVESAFDSCVLAWRHIRFFDRNPEGPTKRLPGIQLARLQEISLSQLAIEWLRLGRLHRFVRRLARAHSAHLFHRIPVPISITEARHVGLRSALQDTLTRRMPGRVGHDCVEQWMNTLSMEFGLK